MTKKKIKVNENLIRINLNYIKTLFQINNMEFSCFPRFRWLHYELDYDRGDNHRANHANSKSGPQFMSLLFCLTQPFILPLPAPNNVPSVLEVVQP